MAFSSSVYPLVWRIVFSPLFLTFRDFPLCRPRPPDCQRFSEDVVLPPHRSPFPWDVPFFITGALETPRFLPPFILSRNFPSFSFGEPSFRLTQTIFHGSPPNLFYRLFVFKIYTLEEVHFLTSTIFFPNVVWTWVLSPLYCGTLVFPENNFLKIHPPRCRPPPFPTTGFSPPFLSRPLAHGRTLRFLHPPQFISNSPFVGVSVFLRFSLLPDERSGLSKFLFPSIFLPWRRRLRLLS